MIYLSSLDRGLEAWEAKDSLCGMKMAGECLENKRIAQPWTGQNHG